MELFGAVLLLVFCSACVADSYHRDKPVLERWIWQTTVYDPCIDYNPIKPYFAAPGRRISEEKCLEYVWTMQKEDEQSQRKSECWLKTSTTSTTSRYEQVLRYYEVGGRSTVSGEYPHMGAIGWEAVTGGYIFKCGSTLISSKFVMTAAHCIRASPLDTTLVSVDPKIIRLNNANLYPENSQIDDPYNHPYNPADVNISRIIVHPEFKPPKKYYDIALMELAHEITFSSLVRPACLWGKADTGEYGNEVTTTGWGVLAQEICTPSGSMETSSNLQAADILLVDSELCDRLLYEHRNRHWQGLQDHQICAGKLAGGVDACQGDSGGPLQFRKLIHISSSGYLYYVVGVTSFGIGCALPNHPGIYTRVSSFIDWIEGHVWK